MQYFCLKCLEWCIFICSCVDYSVKNNVKGRITNFSPNLRLLIAYSSPSMTGVLI